MNKIYLISVSSDKTVVKHTKFSSIKWLLESPYRTMFDPEEMDELIAGKRTQCAARVFKYMSDDNDNALNSTLLLFMEDNDLTEDEINSMALAKLRDFDFINTLIANEEKLNRIRYIVGNTILISVISAIVYGLYTLIKN